MKKQWRGLAAAVMAAVVLTGCAGTGGADSQSAEVGQTNVRQPEAMQTETNQSGGDQALPSGEASQKDFKPVTLKVAYMPNMGSASAIIAGRDQGFYKEMGITVKLVQFQGGPAEIAAMASGDIDISQIGHGAHALCVEGQAQIFGLDLYGKSDEVLANQSKGINRIEDLKGKKVAVTAGTSSEIVLDLALERAGMTRDDLEVVEMDANGAVTAMISGNVDACASWSPSTNIIKEKMGDKVVSLAGNADFFDKVAFPGSFIATEKFAKDNREVLVRFYAATLKAMDYRKDHVEDVCRELAKEIEADPDTIIATKDNYEWLTSEDVEKSLEDGSLKKCYESQQQVFLDSGRITEPVPVENYVMFDVMKDALALYRQGTPQ